MKALLRIFSSVAFLLNSLIAIGLIASHFSIYINPKHFFLFGLLGMSFPFWLLLSILFMVYWIYKFNRRFLISLVAIIISYSSLGNMYQMSSDRKENIKAVRVLSYNVRLFNLYKWIDQPSIDQEQIELVVSQKADIIAFQEYHNKNKAVQQLNMPYKKVELIRDDKNFGLALYSKFPIISSRLIHLGTSTNGAMCADLLIDSDTVRVFNVHLASLKLGASDYAFLDNINQNSNEEAIKKGSRKILSNMKLAYVNRSNQVELLQAEIKKSPYPVILMGDFNDIPQSYTYNQLSENLQDAFIESGFGFGKTYTKYLPTFRIDYILHSANWDAYNYKVLDNEKLSDHYPIIVDLLPSN